LCFFFSLSLLISFFRWSVFPRKRIPASPAHARNYWFHPSLLQAGHISNFLHTEAWCASSFTELIFAQIVRISPLKEASCSVFRSPRENGFGDGREKMIQSRHTQATHEKTLPKCLSFSPPPLVAPNLPASLTRRTFPATQLKHPVRFFSSYPVRPFQGTVYGNFGPLSLFCLRFCSDSASIEGTIKFPLSNRFTGNTEIDLDWNFYWRKRHEVPPFPTAQKSPLLAGFFPTWPLLRLSVFSTFADLVSVSDLMNDLLKPCPVFAEFHFECTFRQLKTDAPHNLFPVFSEFLPRSGSFCTSFFPRHFFLVLKPAPNVD